jgi:CDP-glucose 4,6-dehydratase
MIDLTFLNNKKILITGHTGFKGRWLVGLLSQLCNAKLICVAPRDIFFKESRVFFEKINIEEVFIDISNAKKVDNLIKKILPDVIIHLGAQSLVNESISNPLKTFSTNILGTANILVAAGALEKKILILNITSDKVYKNSENLEPFNESSELGGLDPYSCSKSCADLISHAFFDTYVKKLKLSKLSIANLRAGNVIGGGDFGVNRIIPDIYRSAKTGEVLELRMPYAIRPWQHVLDCLFGYLYALKHISKSEDTMSVSFNVGPQDSNNLTVLDLCEKAKKWFPALSFNTNSELVAESKFLLLDSNLLSQSTGWKPVYDTYKAVEQTFKWYYNFENGANVSDLVNKEIQDYLTNGN